jgi:NADPH:quinone reductase-like Zn-dependent oxidoreductase
MKSVIVFENKANGMDVVVDLVDGETPSRSYAVAKKGGVLATRFSR